MVGQQDTSGQGSAPQTPEALLAQITKELEALEGKKSLKGELDAFVTKQKAAVGDYEKAYPDLRKAWCKQQQDLQDISARLRRSFPDWKEMITKCVCSAQQTLACVRQKADGRRRCSQGARERARDHAKAAFDQAKARQETLQANAQKAKAALDANAKAITDLQTLFTKPDDAAAGVYLFWFTVLPLHKQLAPEDLQAECDKLGAHETPAELCKSVMDGGCPADPDACTPPKGYDDAKGSGNGGSKPRRVAPWLVSPSNYPGEINAAWQDQRDAKTAADDAKAAFDKDPDDLAALDKQAEALAKTLDDAIKACLKAYKPHDSCCDKPAAKATEE